MRCLILVPCVLLLSSCGVISAIASGAERLNDGLVKLDAAVTKYQQIAEAADTDGDGKTDSSEWMAYLLGLIGVGGAAVARGAIRNAKSDGRKDAIEARLDAVEKT